MVLQVYHNLAHKQIPDDLNLKRRTVFSNCIDYEGITPFISINRP